jgi:uncharacterized repeat protein (TIGR01451 family)
LRVDQPGNFQVEVVNRSAEKLTGVLIVVSFPQGLKHPKFHDLDKLEAPLDDLQPNSKRVFPVPMLAKLPGRHVVDFRLVTQNGSEAQGTAEVLVTTQGVHIEQAPATRLVLHRDGELRLEVTNHEPKQLDNVTVINQLPDGVDFVYASERGIYRPESRTVYWLLKSLSPGQTQPLLVKVQPIKNGQFTNQVIVKAQHLAEQRSSSQLQVEGVTDLVVKIAKKDEAIEVGKDTVYEIRLINHGNTSATNVQLTLTLTEGLAPKQAQGPVGFRMTGQLVQFAAVPSLPPGSQAVFHLQARGEAVGDRRVRAQVACDQLSQPLNKEERTVVYRDR